MRGLLRLEAMSSAAQPGVRRDRWLIAIAVVAAGCGTPSQASESPLDRATDAAWPVVNQWDPRLEAEYADFVTRLGEAVEARRCRRLADCLRDPAANTTYEPAIDAALKLHLDCADLPYVLRAYFSFKRRLPFGFVASTRGTGRDPRYAVGIAPTAYRTWRDYPTPRALLRGVVGQVHSGMYRMAPQVEGSDFYPLRVAPGVVQPGAIYYDPNGHVLVVARVRPDGAVYLIDGHPDGSLTWKRFGAAFAIGTARLGGGFKAFRPLRVRGDEVLRAANAELPDFDGVSQYAHHDDPTAAEGGGYHAWVRAALTVTGVAVDPFAEFREQLEAVCGDLADRAAAVDAAIAAGLAGQPHPEALPENIYGTEGDWEVYSTPSRDARLKAAVRQLRAYADGLPRNAFVTLVLRALWWQTGSSAACRTSYRDSLGRTVDLGLDAVIDRLFALSFDPYHCPELRWGATASSELASCPDDATKRGWYDAERRLRYRIDRAYGVPTPLDDGPEQPPDIDPRRAFTR